MTIDQKGSTFEIKAKIVQLPRRTFSFSVIKDVPFPILTWKVQK